VNNNISVQDNTTIGGTLAVTGASTMTGALSVNNNLSVQDNKTIGGTLEVTGASTMTGALTVNNNLSVQDNVTIGGTLDVTGATTISGDLTVTGLATLSSIEITDNATIGTLYTDTIMSADGETSIIRAESDGTVHIGENSLVFDATNDVISSSSGLLTLGDTESHVTKIRGVLSINDPTEPDHAATRRYVDQSAAMAAALDTRNPEKGKNFHVQLGGATKNKENALGLNFAGSMFLVNAPGADGALPFSVSAGVSESAGQYMGKISVGLSW
ncbi:hypothetical protein N9C75_03965, partial [Alphaproteobacteria bacterium]|nr:hypothetical protein [Alphaproteobacteria bacterium]